MLLLSTRRPGMRPPRALVSPNSALPCYRLRFARHVLLPGNRTKLVSRVYVISPPHEQACARSGVVGVRPRPGHNEPCVCRQQREMNILTIFSPRLPASQMKIFRRAFFRPSAVTRSFPRAHTIHHIHTKIDKSKRSSCKTHQ